MRHNGNTIGMQADNGNSKRNGLPWWPTTEDHSLLVDTRYRDGECRHLEDGLEDGRNSNASVVRNVHGTLAQHGTKRVKMVHFPI